jgi:hypothetical protein
MNERLALLAGTHPIRATASPSSDQAEWAILHPVGQWLIRDRCRSMRDEKVTDRTLETSHRSKRLAQRREHHEIAALLSHGCRRPVTLCGLSRHLPRGGRNEQEVA